MTNKIFPVTACLLGTPGPHWSPKWRCQNHRCCVFAPGCCLYIHSYTVSWHSTTPTRTSSRGFPCRSVSVSASWNSNLTARVVVTLLAAVGILRRKRARKRRSIWQHGGMKRRASVNVRRLSAVPQPWLCCLYEVHCACTRSTDWRRCVLPSVALTATRPAGRPSSPPTYRSVSPATSYHSQLSL